MKYTLSFPENLKSEMKSAHMSQEKLAKALNTTQATVSRWASGENEPDFQTLLQICQILNVTPNELLGWED